MDRPLREAVKAAGLDSGGITPHVRRIRRSQSWFRPGLTYRPYSGSAAIRRWRWCSAPRRSRPAYLRRDPGDRQDAPETGRERNRKSDYIKITSGRSKWACREAGKQAQIERSWNGLDVGGRKRNRTAVRGFAVLCIATLPSGRGHRHIGVRRSLGQGESPPWGLSQIRAGARSSAGSSNSGRRSWNDHSGIVCFEQYLFQLKCGLNDLQYCPSCRSLSRHVQGC